MVQPHGLVAFLRRHRLRLQFKPPHKHKVLQQHKVLLLQQLLGSMTQKQQVLLPMHQQQIQVLPMHHQQHQQQQMFRVLLPMALQQHQVLRMNRTTTAGRATPGMAAAGRATHGMVKSGSHQCLRGGRIARSRRGRGAWTFLCLGSCR